MPKYAYRSKLRPLHDPTPPYAPPGAAQFVDERGVLYQSYAATAYTGGRIERPHMERLYSSREAEPDRRFCARAYDGAGNLLAEAFAPREFEAHLLLRESDNLKPQTDR